MSLGGAVGNLAEISCLWLTIIANRFAFIWPEQNTSALLCFWH
jgi:hypothetical protein